MLRPALWPCPASGDEYALTSGTERAVRLLIIPALFDEENRMRHFTAEVMRNLDRAGVDTILPDLAGCNESGAPMSEQTLSGWRDQIRAAAQHFGATHILSIRAGAMLDPCSLPGFRYAPVGTSSVLRSLLRGRVLSEREAGGEISREALLAEGLSSGLALAGYRLSAQMLAQMHEFSLPESAALEIAQADIGGPGLWMRAEPGHDPQQAANLARLMAEHLA